MGSARLFLYVSLAFVSLLLWERWWVAYADGTGKHRVDDGILAAVEVLESAGANKMGKHRLFTYPDPIRIRVLLEGGVGAVILADVSATVTFPSGNTRQLAFFDDGITPDAVPQDGFYSTLLADYPEDGVYKFDILATNLKGRAMIKQMGGLPPPAGASLLSSTAALTTFGTATYNYYLPAGARLPPPTAAPPFERKLSVQVVVTGLDKKLVPHSSISSPVLMPDGTADVKGIIERAGQIDYYQFHARASSTYYIMTYSLHGFDHVEMVTRVNLYDLDGKTLINSSERFDNTNISFIRWSPNVTGDYLVTVEHVENARGLYSFGVSLTNRQPLSSGPSRPSPLSPPRKEEVKDQ